MKQALAKTLLFVLLIPIIDYGVSELILYKRKKFGKEVYFFVKRWEEFHALPKNSLDVLFLGSSHCYRSLSPKVFKQELGLESFNLGSSSQTMKTSYGVLAEALEYQKPQKVILEVFHETMGQMDELRNASFNFDFLGNMGRKGLLKYNGWREYFFLEWFRSSRLSNYSFLLFENAPLEKDLSNSHGGDYDRGFISREGTGLESLGETVRYSFSPIDEGQLKALQGIIKLCKHNNIELMCVTQPYHPEYLQGRREEYQQFHDCLFPFLSNNNILWLDYNLVPEFINSSDYYDWGHVLHAGAIKFSKRICNDLLSDEVF